MESIEGFAYGTDEFGFDENAADGFLGENIRAREMNPAIQSQNWSARCSVNLLIVLIGVTALGLIWGMVCTAPGIPWNGARLAPSFALARGLPLYALRDTGAHLGWVYGPGFPLWYLPMGLTDNPTVGLMLASLWNAVTIIAPLGLIAWIAAPRAAKISSFVTGLGVILLLANPITREAFLFIHVDAVCIAWAVVACTALHGSAIRGWRPGLPVAAVAVALSVVAKQVSVVLVPATLMWLAWEGRRHLIGKWLFWLAAACGSLAVLFFALFGAEGMLFNAWLLFSRMPWQGGWEIFWRNAGQVLWSGWLWWLAALLVAAALRFSWRERIAPDAHALARLFICLALWQLPLGLMASMVVDAALNSIHAINYLMMAGLVGMASVLARQDLADAARLWRALMATVVLGILATVPRALDPGIVWTPYRGQEELLALARRHQGKIYLPWNPLTTVITERKIYPFDEALHYLWLARLEPPLEAILASVPDGALIVYQEPSQSHFALRYFGRNRDLAGRPVTPSIPPQELAPAKKD